MLGGWRGGADITAVDRTFGPLLEDDMRFDDDGHGDDCTRTKRADLCYELRVQCFEATVRQILIGTLQRRVFAGDGIIPWPSSPPHRTDDKKQGTPRREFRDVSGFMVLSQAVRINFELSDESGAGACLCLGSASDTHTAQLACSWSGFRRVSCRRPEDNQLFPPPAVCGNRPTVCSSSYRCLNAYQLKGRRENVLFSVTTGSADSPEF
ncbi:unnamed protein product [Soboliphyme baturini]|uniref:Uncharacterized protein n=1 Tax=Soboliphyme baturini TaxID=241478 RepID=A0A183ICL4_9BILA|nr:unnamed protein product [Soboliphyme baturini]